jgi:hypothetical protein
MEITKCSRFPSPGDRVRRVSRWEDLRYMDDVIKKNHKIHWECEKCEGIDYCTPMGCCDEHRTGLCSKRPDWCVRFLDGAACQVMAIDKNGFVVEYGKEDPVHQKQQEQQQAHQEHQKRLEDQDPELRRERLMHQKNQEQRGHQEHQGDQSHQGIPGHQAHQEQQGNQGQQGHQKRRGYQEYHGSLGYDPFKLPNL